MSAILSADDLNDFISPGVACIKPIETLPAQAPQAFDPDNPYQVTTEDVAAAAEPPPPAQISLTDCLACSGCVTSAEAILVSLQSHQEVLNTLDAHPAIDVTSSAHRSDGRIFVASVAPQVRASIAATYNVSEREAGNMINQLLSGPQGLASGGTYGSAFTWIIDTNTVREMCQAACVAEALGDNAASANTPKTPILASACPGWICYAEKTHPHVLPHLSRLKSPQALAGTMVKSVLAQRFGMSPDRVWHVALMPCFDKKLEASREELTDTYWTPDGQNKTGARDVDCVITARELIMLADARGIRFPALPRTPVRHTPFPDSTLDTFLFPRGRRRQTLGQSQQQGSSGGYAYTVLDALRQRTPGSTLHVERGRNIDVLEYVLERQGQTIAKTARYYGFRNIQNLVRRLKPAKTSRMPGGRSVAGRRPGAANGAGAGAAAMTEYLYVEVMACPGGCTNGGGQIKASDAPGLVGLATGEERKTGAAEQKEWLARVDEAYYSADSGAEEEEPESDDHMVNGTADGAATQNGEYMTGVMQHWSACTGIALDALLYTSYRRVESDVGKLAKGNDMERVAGLAASVGGGW